MTPEKQIKALAELDGWSLREAEEMQFCYPGGYANVKVVKWFKDWNENGFNLYSGYTTENLPSYLTSYDAIIPLRIKVCNTPALKVAWLNHARTIIARRAGKLVSDFDIASIKPDEDCEALLRATGKWEE